MIKKVNVFTLPKIFDLLW